MNRHQVVAHPTLDEILAADQWARTKRGAVHPAPNFLIMILHIARVALVVLEVVLLFNLLIIVHELGHFLAARWRGLYIEKFGMWFGKPLWKKTIGGVQYSLGSIPFGGFVALPQLAPMDVIEGRPTSSGSSSRRISALDKIIVASPARFSACCSRLFFACIVWVVGHPVGESDIRRQSDTSSVIRPQQKPACDPATRFWKSMATGKTLFGMNDSVTWSVVRSEGDKIPVKFQRDGRRADRSGETLHGKDQGWRRKSVRQRDHCRRKYSDRKSRTGYACCDCRTTIGRCHCRVNGAANLRSRSRRRLPGVRRSRSSSTCDAVADDFATVTPTLLPTEGEMKWRSELAGRKMSRRAPEPIEQVQHSITSTFETIGAVASPKSDVKLQHMSGPIMIGHIYYLLFGGESGWQLALWFSVVLNVNLAILNMLPIPVLDGGHIVLALIESVRRKPVNMRVLE